MKLAFRISTFLLAWALFAAPILRAAESAPLRVAIAGLVHGHVEGFLEFHSSAGYTHRGNQRSESQPLRSLCGSVQA